MVILQVLGTAGCAKHLVGFPLQQSIRFDVFDINKMFGIYFSAFGPDGNSVIGTLNNRPDLKTIQLMRIQ